MFRVFRSFVRLFEHSTTSPRQQHSVFTAAQRVERNTLLKQIYSPFHELEKGSAEYNALANSGKVWHEWHRHDDSVEKGYFVLQRTFKDLLAEADALKLEMKNNLPLGCDDVWHQTTLISSRQSCAIENCNISTAAWTKLDGFLRREVLGKPLEIAAEKLVSRSFVVPADLLPDEDRNTVQEIANHILVNSWGTARHMGVMNTTLPSLTMSEIRCLCAFQLRNTRGELLHSHGWGHRTVLGDTRVIPIQVASNHMVVFPYPEEIKANLERCFAWLTKVDQASRNGLHPLLVAVQLMVYFVNIHPFNDGNGRMSRLLLQDHVYRHGFGPVILPEPLDRAVYLERINGASNGFPEELVRMYSHAVLRGLRALRHGGRLNLNQIDER